ncbi:MAG: SgcJ/EcaC family oxidoreductase [Bryobacteraceae bacterium]|nr:SgcJ/EcaC family oxidoreductase [Bryobacteraceae bacterium]
MSDHRPNIGGIVVLEIRMQIRRSLALAILSALGLSGCTKAPATFTDADRTAIRSMIEEFTSAVSKGDFVTAASLYAEDGVAMPPNAPAAEGRAAIQKVLEGFGRPQAFSQPVVEIDGVGDLAYARVNYELTFTPPKATAPVTDKGKVLIVMRKQSDGNWRTTRAMHNSNLPAAR